MKVDSGPGIEGRALPDTGIQINVISGGMFAKLQAEYPLTTLLTQSTFPVVLADQAIPQAVGTTEPLNITVTSGVARPVQVSLIVFVVSEGDDDLLSLRDPIVVAKLGIDVKNILINLLANVAEGHILCAVVSMWATRGAYAYSDLPATLLTNRARRLIRAPDEEMPGRVRLLQKGVDISVQEGMGTEDLTELTQAVLANLKRVSELVWEGKIPQRMCSL